MDVNMEYNHTHAVNPMVSLLGPYPAPDAAIRSYIDESSSCVVNIDSINRRLRGMGRDEEEYVRAVSEKFLYLVVRLAHAPDVNQVREEVVALVDLILKNIFDDTVRTTRLGTFRKAEEMIGESQADAVFNNVLGALEPQKIIASMLGGPKGASGVEAAVDAVLSVLRGYNPLKLDDHVMLAQCLSEGMPCRACFSLKAALSGPGSGASPQEVLAYFLRCSNHDRLDFGSDHSAAAASANFRQNTGKPNVLVVPLADVLLGCLGQHAGERLTLAHTANPEWPRVLEETVACMPLEERALACQIYAFMFFSRHRRQTSNSLKQFLYTVFVRFIYSASEMLFCSHENASVEVDGGNFLRFVDATLNTTILSSTLNVLKAVYNWRQGSSIAPVLDMLISNRRILYDSKDLETAGKGVERVVDSMASMHKGRTSARPDKPKLDSIRSVRQAEKYMPYGLVDMTSVPRVSKEGLSFQAITSSNGRNFDCNSLHVLPTFKGCGCLGQAGMGHQSLFEKVACLDQVASNFDQGTGDMLGFFTALADKVGLGNAFPLPGQEGERLAKFVSLLFQKRLFSQEIASGNGFRTLPEKRLLNQTLQDLGLPGRLLDARLHALLLIWQQPNIEASNASSLTTSQLELLLSRRNENWSRLITRAYFTAERVSFQLADTLIKNLNGTRPSAGGGCETHSILDLLTSGLNRDTIVLQAIIEGALNDIASSWFVAADGGDHDHGPVREGPKAFFAGNLFNIVHKIVIEEDMKPSCLIAESKKLSNAINLMDELLMAVHS
uniref:Wsv332-like protein n=1 Tax=Sicyonia whispovirus TaxID=2984283 RepID=A0A9C7CEG1_9VIRU|nr:MAG: wsv332-like protein [Sicyonia whispovirus]